MKISVTHILKDLRELYTIEDRFERFNAYIALFSGNTRGEFFPIGVFSPMGKRQPGYLDRLLALDSERIALYVANEVADEFSMLPDRFRLMLVVADVPRNGWTERNLTDAEWRFTLKTDTVPQNSPTEKFDRWVTVQLWTDMEPTRRYVERETRAAIYRALYYRYVRTPFTLKEMMRQEGHVLAYAGYEPELNGEELEYSREIIHPYLQSSDFPVCFSAMYGDAAARQAGYRPLGLSDKAGFHVALEDEALSSQSSLTDIFEQATGL